MPSISGPRYVTGTKSYSRCSTVTVHAKLNISNVYGFHSVSGLQIYLNHVTVMLTSYMKFFCRDYKFDKVSEV